MLLLCGLMTGCSYTNASVVTPTDFFLMQATDLHVLSPEMYDDSELLRQIEKMGDGKQIIGSYDLFQKLITKVKSERPDGLVLTGDIVFHGDIESYRLVAKGLQELVDEGIRVYVLPGNHDWNTTPYGYSGEEAHRIQETTVKDFEQIYHNFGPKQALFQDQASFSYVAEVNPSTWLIMLDASQPGKMSILQERTIDWLKPILKQAKDRNIQLITASHYNLFQHHPMFERGYKLIGADQLLEILTEYPPLIHLSGHLHVQHLAEQSGVSEAVTGSLSVYPHHVAEIRPTGYQAKSLLESPEEMAKAAEYFRQVTISKMLPRVIESGIDNAEDMAEFIADVNLQFFAGNLTTLPELMKTDIAKDWLNVPEDVRLGRYIHYILNEEPQDFRIKEFN